MVPWISSNPVVPRPPGDSWCSRPTDPNDIRDSMVPQGLGRLATEWVRVAVPMMAIISSAVNSKYFAHIDNGTTTSNCPDPHCVYLFACQCEDMCLFVLWVVG